MSQQKNSSEEIIDNGDNGIAHVPKNASGQAGGSTDPSLSSAAGFSEAERNVIIDEINDIVSSNKIVISQDRLQPKATRNSLTVPLIINLALVAIILVVSLAGYLAFLGQQRARIQESQDFYSPESRLVRDIIRKSEERVAAREAELASIQAQLDQVSNELGRLEENVELQVEERRQQLLTTLEADFAERARQLEEENYSREEVIALLEEPRRQAEQQLESEINRFRDILDEEKQKREQELTALRSELSVDITLKESEITSLQGRLEESQNSLLALQESQNLQLTELRQQLEDETEAFEDRYVQLRRAQEQANAADEQVLSLVSASLEDLQTENFGQLSGRLDTVEDYVEGGQYTESFSQDKVSFYLQLVTALREYQELKEDDTQRISDVLVVQEEVASVSGELEALRGLSEEFQGIVSTYSSNIEQVENLVSQATQNSTARAENLLLAPIVEAEDLFPQFGELYNRIDRLQERQLTDDTESRLERTQDVTQDTVLDNVNAVIRAASGDVTYANRAANLQRTDARFSVIYRTISDLITQANRSNDDASEDKFLLGFVASTTGKEEFVIQNLSQISVKVGTNVELYRVSLQGERFIADGIVIRIDGPILQAQLSQRAEEGLVSKYDIVYFRR